MILEDNRGLTWGEGKVGLSGGGEGRKSGNYNNINNKNIFLKKKQSQLLPTNL